MLKSIFIRSCFFGLALMCFVHTLTIPVLRAQVNPAAFLRRDPTNPQYFYYANKTQAMVGTSASYLPHVKQVNTNHNRNNTYCTLQNYTQCVQEIRNKGMNKLRLWVSLNHSPGTLPTDAMPKPYPHEQPFDFITLANGQKVWDLDDYDDADDAVDSNDGFFTNLRKVIQYCHVAPVVFVEVTIFDPWLGEWTLGPWYRNKQGLYFRNPVTLAPDKDYFLRLDNPNFNVNLPANDTDNKTDLDDWNRELRKRQVKVMKKLVDTIWDLKNVYWEMANEADYDTGNFSGMTLWHKYMMKELYDYETAKGVHHMIAANFASPAMLDAAKTMPAEIVTTHYTHYWSPSTYGGAVETIRKRNVSGGNNVVFGFNEDRITGFFDATYDAATADSTRVGAWEFMMNEGGIIDHLNYDWVNFSNPGANNTESTKANTQLGMLNKFLRTLPLATMQRYDAPLWVQNMPASSYPLRNKTNQTNNVLKYFGTMSSGQNVHVLYIHYSRVSTNNAAMFLPDTGTSRTENLKLQSLGPGGEFKYEWFVPKNLQFDANGDPIAAFSGTFPWNNGPGEVATLAPFSFFGDAVLRVTRKVPLP